MDSWFPIVNVKRLTFTPRPQSVPASSRPLYRIALLLLVLELNCRTGGASFLKLQFFNWVLKDPMLQHLTKTHVDTERVYSISQVQLDPAVNLALRYAFAEGLLTTGSKRFILTQRGHALVQKLIDDQTVFRTEKEFLSDLGQRVSEVRLQKQELGI